MHKKFGTFLGNTAVRIVWSVAISTVVSLSIILLGRFMGTKRIGLWEIFKQNLPVMILAFFVPSFSLLFSHYLISLASQKSTPRFWLRIEERFRRIDGKARLLVAVFFKWLGVCLFLMSLVFLLLMLDEVLVSTPHGFLDIPLLAVSYLLFFRA